MYAWIVGSNGSRGSDTGRGIGGAHETSDRAGIGTERGYSNPE
jgi:hypothetical protein